MAGGVTVLTEDKTWAAAAEGFTQAKTDLVKLDINEAMARRNADFENELIIKRQSLSMKAQHDFTMEAMRKDYGFQQAAIKDAEERAIKRQSDAQRETGGVSDFQNNSEATYGALIRGEIDEAGADSAIEQIITGADIYNSEDYGYKYASRLNSVLNERRSKKISAKTALIRMKQMGYSTEGRAPQTKEVNGVLYQESSYGTGDWQQIADTRVPRSYPGKQGLMVETAYGSNKFDVVPGTEPDKDYQMMTADDGSVYAIDRSDPTKVVKVGITARDPEAWREESWKASALKLLADYSNTASIDDGDGNLRRPNAQEVAAYRQSIIQEAQALYGTQPGADNAEIQDAYKSGRLTDADMADIQTALAQNPGNLNVILTRIRGMK